MSANSVLQDTHFEDIHTFRLDWQPGGGGRKGYLRWLLDDVQLYGIDDDTLVRRAVRSFFSGIFFSWQERTWKKWGRQDRALPACLLDKSAGREYMFSCERRNIDNNAAVCVLCFRAYDATTTAVYLVCVCVCFFFFFRRYDIAKRYIFVACPPMVVL